jgi:hypothetical protein
MRKDGWQVQRDGDALVLARRWPVRWDLSVVRLLPEMGSRARLARQVLQDMWRALRDLRGFQPAVRVLRVAGGWQVTAGGQVDGPVPRAHAEARIAEVLDCANCRARWARWAA